MLSSHLRLGLRSGIFPRGFLTKTLYTHLLSPIQGVSRLVDITAGGDFLGFCDQKKVHINMCPILDGYGVMTA